MVSELSVWRVNAHDEHVFEHGAVCVEFRFPGFVEMFGTDDGEEDTAVVVEFVVGMVAV